MSLDYFLSHLLLLAKLFKQWSEKSKIVSKIYIKSQITSTQILFMCGTSWQIDTHEIFSRYSKDKRDKNCRIFLRPLDHTIKERFLSIFPDSSSAKHLAFYYSDKNQLNESEFTRIYVSTLQANVAILRTHFNTPVNTLHSQKHKCAPHTTHRTARLEPKLTNQYPNHANRNLALRGWPISQQAHGDFLGAFGTLYMKAD